MSVIASVLVLFSVLVPSKLWYTPTQPIEISVEAQTPMYLSVRTASGKELEPEGTNQIPAGQQTVDIKKMFPGLSEAGTYVVFAVPQGKPESEFAGTPIVIQARSAKRQADVVNVYWVAPLSYVTINTDKGEVKAAMWYDAAPNTVASFLQLSKDGYYDGQTFHRIVPGFVVQGGDPTGTGFGGPGYTLQAEFNDRTHEEGVLSMAREGDPLEGRGIPPRHEFANSAGSQFFICLSREKCQSLDRKYTAFGKVFSGMDAIQEIAKAELADASSGKPKEPQRINSIKVVAVTAADNPYSTMLKLDQADTDVTTQPADAVKAEPVDGEAAPTTQAQ